MFLWNDTWLISGKSFSTWQEVMKFLPEDGNWQLHSPSSADTVCKSEYLTLLRVHLISTFYFINFQFVTRNNDNLFKNSDLYLKCTESSK